MTRMISALAHMRRRAPSVSKSCPPTLLDWSLTRRAALSLAAWSLASVGPRPPAAFALVDGIPLYAPGDKVSLPDRGFEYWLPQMEQLRDSYMPSLRASVSAADWRAAAPIISGDALTASLQAFGGTASILGDEAYTALALKQRYAQAAKQLQKTIVADAPSTQAALTSVAELESSVNDLLALVPASVVEAVRAFEAKQRAAALAAAAPPPLPPPPPSPAPLDPPLASPALSSAP